MNMCLLSLGPCVINFAKSCYKKFGHKHTGADSILT